MADPPRDTQSVDLRALQELYQHILYINADA